MRDFRKSQLKNKINPKSFFHYLLLSAWRRGAVTYNCAALLLKIHQRKAHIDFSDIRLYIPNFYNRIIRRCCKAKLVWNWLHKVRKKKKTIKKLTISAYLIVLIIIHFVKKYFKKNALAASHFVRQSKFSTFPFHKRLQIIYYPQINFDCPLLNKLYKNKTVGVVFTFCLLIWNLLIALL